MLKVWLDDERPAPMGWIWIQSARMARAFLWYFAEGIEELALDNDLGVCRSCEAQRCINSSDHRLDRIRGSDCYCDCHDTGYDVIKFVARYDLWPIHRPTCHSDNPWGRVNILATIERYGPY
jgi:hypothetical protein